jgi:hypothetical protein
MQDAMFGICQVTTISVIERSANPNASDKLLLVSAAVATCETKAPAIRMLKVVTAAIKTVSSM